MMEKGDFSNVTVCALTKKAGVGRASFYRHYTDTSDVIRQYLDRLTSQWRNVFDKTPEKDQMRLLLTHFYQHKRFYLALYRAGLSDMLRIEIQDAFQQSRQTDNCTAYLIGWLLLMAEARRVLENTMVQYVHITKGNAHASDSSSHHIAQAVPYGMCCSDPVVSWKEMTCHALVPCAVTPA